VLIGGCRSHQRENLDGAILRSICKSAHTLVAKRGHRVAEVLHGGSLCFVGIHISARKLGFEHFQKIVARIITKTLDLLERNAVITGHAHVLEAQWRRRHARPNIVNACCAVELFVLARFRRRLALLDSLDKDSF